MKKFSETVIVPVRVSHTPSYALAAKIPSKNGVVIKVLHNLLDGKPAYFGQAALEEVLSHLGRGALIDQRLAPSDAEIEGLRRSKLEQKFEDDFAGHEWLDPASELDAMKQYSLYCGLCDHGLGCEHGVPAPYYGPGLAFLRGKYAVFGIARWKVTNIDDDTVVASGEVEYPLMRTDNYAFAKRVLRKLSSDYYITPNNDCSRCGQEQGKNPQCRLCMGFEYPAAVLTDEEVGIFQKRQTIHVERYGLDYEYRSEPNTGNGYSFPCDKEGNVLVDEMAPESLDTLEKCRNGEYDVVCKGVVDYSHDYRQPALLRCYCNQTVELHNPLTNECDCCGRLYNMSGQLLNPRSQWDYDCVGY